MIVAATHALPGYIKILMKVKLPLSIIGFFQALGLVLYCAAVGFLMISGEVWFGPMVGILGFVLFLLLFVVSALISAGIVLGYPAWLFLQKRISQAIDLVIWTVFWLLAILLTLILGFLM